MAQFFVRNSATEYFSEKIFFNGHSSGHTGSYDTCLKLISCRGAEKKGGHTHRQILSILYIDCAKVSYIKTIGGVAFSLIILVIKNLYLLDCEK